MTKSVKRTVRYASTILQTKIRWICWTILKKNIITCGIIDKLSCFSGYCGFDTTFDVTDNDISSRSTPYTLQY